MINYSGLVATTPAYTMLAVSPVTAMSSQAADAYDLSILELLHALNEKLGLECARMRAIRLPLVVPTGSLETDVRVS